MVKSSEKFERISHVIGLLEEHEKGMESWLEKPDDTGYLSDYDVHHNEVYQYEIDLCEKLIRILEKGI